MITPDFPLFPSNSQKELKVFEQNEIEKYQIVSRRKLF